MALLKDSLIAQYNMNDDAATAVVVDETGDHNGEYQLNDVAQNTSTGASTGKILGALDFVGGANGEHVEITDHDDFSPGDGTAGSNTPFSIDTWIYMHDATNFAIASKGVFGTDMEWWFRVMGTDKIEFIKFDESIDNCWVGRRYNTVLTGYENQWIHLAGTSGGGILSSDFKIYINAVRVDDMDVNNAVFVAVENLTAPVHIGRYSVNYANGLIDIMRFWNKKLTPLEVKYLYNSGAGVESIPTLIELSRTGQGLASQQW